MQNSGTVGAKYCRACGVKVWAARERCPRCGGPLGVVTAEEPAAEPRDRRATLAAVAVLLGLAAGVALWPRASEPERAVPVTARGGADATRRASTPGGPAGSAAVGDIGAPDVEPPFLDASGAGALAYRRGDYGAALAAFQQAVEANPDDAESLSNLGQVLVRLGRPSEAVPLFQRAIERLPRRWAYHFNLARAYGELGQWEQAVTEYRVARELFPDDYVTEFNLARALHKLGDEAAAVEAYRRAIALAPEEATFQLALATSLERLGRREEAVQAYREYLARIPEGPDAERVKARIQLLSQASSPPGEALVPAGAAAGPR